MKNKALLLAIGLGAFVNFASCSGSSIQGVLGGGGRDKDPGGDDGGDSDSPDSNANDVSIEHISVESVGGEFPDELGNDVKSVDAVDTSRSLVQILDANAIGERLRRVFPDFRKARTSLILPNEEADLGTIVQFGRPGSWKSKWLESVTQEYIRTLRSVVFGACSQLVPKEYGIVAKDASKGSAMTLVRHPEAPTKEDVSTFMSAVFGYSPPGGALHSGASEYATAFSANIDAYAGEDRVDFIKANYRVMCLAIGQDMRVYLR